MKMESTIKTTSVIGLGKLGACMAGCFAAKGFPTIGVDLNINFVDVINAGKAPVDETDLTEIITKGQSRLSATQDYGKAILESDATFVIVPTPSEVHGGFSLKYVKKSFEEIGKVLKKKKQGYHLIVLTSTVLPGGTEYGLIPILEEISGKKCGVEFGVCYSPEFIALGSVIRDFLNPDFVLIGQSDKKAGGLLAAFYKKVCDNDPPIARMNIINAELTKLSVNSFMTMKISFANLISNLCEKLPGGNVDVVTETLALFGGIGKKSLRGGLGYGGPCLPRDNVALSYLIKNLGYEISLPSAVDQFNRSLVSKLFDIVLKHSQKGSSILVLGLSYKPHTWVIEESQGIALSKFLADSGYELNVYDPKAMEVAKQVLPPTINFANSLEEAVQNSDIVVITTPNQDFKRLSSLISAQKKQFVVIDAWRCLPELSQNSSVKYIPLGIGLDNNLKDKLLQLSM